MNINIRRAYLYIASFIGLILVIIGSIGLINLGLKTWVFTKADTSDLRFICEVRPAPLKEVEEPKPISQEECDQRKAEEGTSRRQRDAAQNIAMIIVGIPVYLYHWRKVKEEKVD